MSRSRAPLGTREQPIPEGAVAGVVQPSQAPRYPDTTLPQVPESNGVVAIPPNGMPCGHWAAALESRIQMRLCRCWFSLYSQFTEELLGITAK